MSDDEFEYSYFDPDEKPVYMEMVAMSAEDAKRFLGRTDEPVDLGPADPERYNPGARVFGFREKDFPTPVKVRKVKP